MSNSAAEKLYLKGMDQIHTAHSAVSAVEGADTAKKFLGSLIAADSILSGNPDHSPDHVSIYIAGGNTSVIRADILQALERIVSQETPTEQKIAAQALLETMTQ